MTTSSQKRPSRPPRPPRSGRGRLLRWIARQKRRKTLWAGVAFSAFALVGLALTVALAVFSRQRGPSEGKWFLLDIPEGQSTRELAHMLAEEGLVESEQLMAFYLALSAYGRVSPGPHLVPGGATPNELTELLSRNPTRRSVKVTIPEGFHRFAIGERLEEQGVVGKDAFLRATVDPVLLEELEIPGRGGKTPESAEGFLFPATYELKLNTPSREVVERLVRESTARWKKVLSKHGDAVDDLSFRYGWSRADIVTLAAMIEKEAAVDDERSTISSVFHNRLSLPTFTPKLLQSDPTSAYGCYAEPGRIPACAGFSGKVTGALNRDRQNRWSTYVNEGLPPGPIANPGERSISAALAPANTPFLYFVAKGAGRHTFSETYEEHKKAIGR